MAANTDSSTQALLHDNAHLVMQTKDVNAQLCQLMANPIRQKLRELGVQDEAAFYAWLEKQASPMDWAQAEQQAQEQLTALLAPPTLVPPTSAARTRRMRSMV
jgi:hypothetical protein